MKRKSSGVRVSQQDPVAIDFKASGRPDARSACTEVSNMLTSREEKLSLSFIPPY